MDRAGAVLEEALNCSICLEILRDPKTLQCGHNYCGRCLQQYLNKASQTSRHLKGIKCPQCRYESLVPDPSKSVAGWVKQLKTNCAIQNVIEGLTGRVMKDCGICESQGNDVKSDHFCKTCNLSLCRSCHDVHARIPVCVDHIMVHIAKDPPKYRSYHFNVHLNTSLSSRQRKRLSLKVRTEVQKKIEVICKKAEESMKDKQTRLRDQANAVVDEIFERFNAGYPVDAPQQWPTDHPGEDSSTDDETDEHRLLASIRLSSKVESFINSRYDVAIAKIQTDEDFKDEDTTNVKEIGNTLESFSDESRLIETEEIHLENDDEDDSSSESSNVSEGLDEDLTPVLHTTIQSMTEEDDNAPWIRNILAMTSCDLETIIVTDFNNSCVKSFYKEDEDINESESHDVSRLVLSGKPWGIAELKNERIAVTCPEKKLICTIRVSPALKKLSDTRVPKAFYGLATIDSSTLVASAPTERPAGLYIIDFNGRILKSIVTDRRGHNMFDSPSYIAMSVWGDILVAEEKARKILTVTKEGQIRGKVSSGKSEALSTLYGITSSEMGGVFLADRGSNKVVLIRDGKDDKVFLSDKDGIFFPRCMCLYRRESMFVAEEGGAIKMFQLVSQ